MAQKRLVALSVFFLQAAREQHKAPAVTQQWDHLDPSQGDDLMR
jgi:hypothetical protein